jgi:hypothetical protein
MNAFDFHPNPRPPLQTGEPTTAPVRPWLAVAAPALDGLRPIQTTNEDTVFQGETRWNPIVSGVKPTTPVIFLCFFASPILSRELHCNPPQ